jgi:hypothetical protein
MDYRISFSRPSTTPGATSQEEMDYFEIFEVAWMVLDNDKNMPPLPSYKLLVSASKKFHENFDGWALRRHLDTNTTRSLVDYRPSLVYH